MTAGVGDGSAIGGERSQQQNQGAVSINNLVIIDELDSENERSHVQHVQGTPRLQGDRVQDANDSDDPNVSQRVSKKARNSQFRSKEKEAISKIIKLKPKSEAPSGSVRSKDTNRKGYLDAKNVKNGGKEAENSKNDGSLLRIG